ncbi:MAG: FHA domain-containing protein [Planctomycetota bacterium]|nr:MAG: FHA domain-containing protein [Planctomycetota bacterium]
MDEGGLPRLADVARAHEEGGAEAVRGLLGVDCALVLSPEGVEELGPTFGTAAWNTRSLSAPVSNDTESGERIAPWASMASPEARVLPLRKQLDRNPFQGVIAVGRAPTNDIVLTAGSVSKQHAFLLQAKDGWKVVDKNSRNGTALNNVSLQPEQECSLRPGDELRIGGLRCMFIDLSGLITLARLMQQSG